MSDFIRAGTELTALQVVLDLGSDATWSDVCAHAAEAVEERNRLRADLARVTAERDALRVAASELVSWDWLHLLFDGDQNARDVVSGVLALRKALGPVGPIGNTARCEHGRPQCLHCEAEREQWNHYVETERDAARAQVRELLKVARAAVAFAMTASGTDFIWERIKLRALVDALPPSMLEEPSDG